MTPDGAHDDRSSRRAGGAKVVALLAAVVVGLAISRGASLAAIAGSTEIRGHEPAAHVLVPLLRPAAAPTATSPGPLLLPLAPGTTAAAALWCASILFALAVLSPADRVRRWRARLVGAPPLRPRFRHH